MKLCQVKTSVHRVVETVCGRTTTLADATIWARDVACPNCLAGRHRDELAELADMHASEAS